jgi:hypothetical protein
MDEVKGVLDAGVLFFPGDFALASLFISNSPVRVLYFTPFALLM